MCNFKFLICVDDSFVLKCFPMRENLLDISAGICSGKDQTNFTNCTVKNISALLFELICIDGQLRHILMPHQFFCFISGFGVVEETIRINTLVAVFKKCVTEDVAGFVVKMIPYKRNCLTIVMLKGILANDSSISTPEIVFGGPATKIIIHFEFLRY